MNESKRNEWYALKVWFTTLATGPLYWGVSRASLTVEDFATDAISIYLFFLLFSIPLTLPSLFLFFMGHELLKKQALRTLTKKILLLGFGQLLLWATFFLMAGQVELTITDGKGLSIPLCYSMALTASVFIYKT